MVFTVNSRERPEVRWATADDLDRYYAGHPMKGSRTTVTAMVGELNGEIIAVGGFSHVRGHLVAFYDMDEKARPYRITLVKAARRMVVDMAERGRMMVAELDPHEPGARRWVESLGFRETDAKGIFLWQG